MNLLPSLFVIRSILVGCKEVKNDGVALDVDDTIDLEEARLISWFLTGLRHEAIRLSKKYERQQKHELLILNNMVSSDTGDEQCEVIDTIAALDDTLAEVEDRMLIKNILALLTPLQRTVIRETVLERNTEKEVAVDLEISQPAVHRIKERALKRLRVVIKEIVD